MQELFERDSAAIEAEIAQLRRDLGAKVSIVAHHYQSDAIVRQAEIVGDSLQLAQRVANLESGNIVFCGVNFMAESAALVARPGQRVFLPAADAKCVMAQMTPAGLLDTVLQKLEFGGRRVLPLAYVNTSVAVKSVVGKHGGAVCTSSNAEKMLRWALAQGESVLFLPDKNLGRNTARQLGLPEEEIKLLDVRGQGSHLPKSGESLPKLLLWPGCCAIHARFRASDILALRGTHPGIKIAVHPECAPEIVQAADAAGSTSFLIDYAAAAPDGSVVGIGTEINLVERLIKQHAGRITIVPLRVTACADMGRTTPQKLLHCLRSIAGQTGPELAPAVPVTVPEQLIPDARLSLTRMLAV
ncbi:MAG: quinolinate synthase NadA [Deltaproteobacteria bacterium]|nr:quinolinate synthase NadA [Deltaproteobacteria bacterium]